ncbi:hypothetical protein CEXT_282291 [Caerostris extrusa]|uniref:Uncharacterized protein n=1 Tax=Caerostris extrusa TaxID=172846 RepID=A0AAV4RLX5_CAEEX|nr:hypothetical protein CEXT_282291 [Caerostris extrusa]
MNSLSIKLWEAMKTFRPQAQKNQLLGTALPCVDLSDEDESLLFLFKKIVVSHEFLSFVNFSSPPGVLTLGRIKRKF